MVLYLLLSLAELLFDILLGALGEGGEARAVVSVSVITAPERGVNKGAHPRFLPKLVMLFMMGIQLMAVETKVAAIGER